jgi:hypothetical protein
MPKSRGYVSDFQAFLLAREGAAAKVTNNNFKGLLQLCEEFRFRDLAIRLFHFRASEDFMKDTEAQIAIRMTDINHSDTLFADGFKFTLENTMLECSVRQGIARSRAVREQLSVDA